MDPPELDSLYAYLSSIASSLHNLHSISVTDYLGVRPAGIALDGLPESVNLAGIRIGDFTQNPFPEDVEPAPLDGFMSEVIRQVSRAISSFTIEGSPALRGRRNQLLADAGDEPMNYLRSTYPAGHFASAAPDEFFAWGLGIWGQNFRDLGSELH